MSDEDDDLFLRLFRKGFRNYYVDEPVTTWCIHKRSTSYSFRMTRSRFRYFIKLSEHFPDDNQKNVFIIRDLLVPRFHKVFFSDVRRCIFSGQFSNNKAELFELYLSFSNIALRARYKSTKFKIKLLARHMFVLTMSLLLDLSPKKAEK